VDKEAANELTCCQRHGGVAASAFDAVIFDTKGDVIGIGSDQQGNDVSKRARLRVVSNG
jgi:hypothetical protein